MNTFQGTSVPFFNALNRQRQLLGIDPMLFMLLLGLSGGIALSSQLRPWMIVISVLHFLAWYFVMLLVCRADNQIMAVIKAHIHTKKYYAPIASIYAKPLITKPSVPVLKGEV